MDEAHIDGAPDNARCPQCRGDLVETRTHTCSVTGVHTQLYLCLACVCGVWLRWTRDRPGKYLVVYTDSANSGLVKSALKGLGWRPPRRPGHPDWTPPA